MQNKTIKQLLMAMMLLMAGFGARAQQHIVINEYKGQKELTATGSITFGPGFEVPAGASLNVYISPAAPLMAVTPNNNFRTVITYTAKKPGIAFLADPGNTIFQVAKEIQTYDQLGRLREILQGRVTPGLNNLVQMKTHTGRGNEPRAYLPYVVDTTLWAFSSGGYSAVPQYFYSGLDTTVMAGTPTSLAYSETENERGPLNRVLKTWAAGSSRPQRVDYMDGSDYVPKYSIVGGLPYKLYGAGEYLNGSQMSVIRTIDENNGGFPDDEREPNGAVMEYRNYLGQVLVKQRVSNQGPSNKRFLNTYYIYDKIGNLSFVLPPKVTDTTTFIPGQTEIDHLGYQYKYDNQNRMIAKKLPGKGWEYMVYNRLNQVVYTQDSVQRANHQWSWAKYDELGRPILTGIEENNSLTPTQVRTAIDALPDPLWEDRSDTGPMGYTVRTHPMAGPENTNIKILNVNYYDDYNIPGLPYAAPAGASKLTRGLATASKVAVIEATGNISSNMLWTVSYYDDDSRVTKTYKQHYLGGAGSYNANNFDEISNTYDFTGAVLTSTRIHKAGGTEAVRTLNEYTYDHAGRKIDSWQTITPGGGTAGTRTLIARNQYDELGNLFKKNLHSTNNGSSFLQTITYRYNPRGWLKRAQAGKLDMTLRYDAPLEGADAQHNGNIAEMAYSTDNRRRSFKYTYDDFNRLTAAEQIQTGSGTGNLNEYISYDKGGNITSMKRGISGTPTVYDYDNSGLSNTLTNLSGGLSGSYTYDGNGNALTDTRRGATIYYNRLNLPRSLTTSIGAATYVYDATGTKIKSTQGSHTSDYIGGVQYYDGSIQFIATEEGQAVRNLGTGVYKYRYNLKDHLGNVRVTFDEQSGAAGVVQEDEYTAFGLASSALANSGDKNNYLYNGKEKQDILADEYDYGARFYDPVIGRWGVIDPLAEISRRFSPYVYCNNNPSRYIDPDGMAVTEGPNGGTLYTGADIGPKYRQLTQRPKVITRKEWGAKDPIKGRDWEKINGSLSRYYNTITVHHSGNAKNNMTIQELQDEEQNSDNKYADIPYHFGIDQFGRIYEGRPLDIKGSHVKKGNTGNIGIVLLSDLDTEDKAMSMAARYVELSDGKATGAMIESLFKLTQYLKSTYGIEYYGGHHEEIPARPCPGNIGMEWVERIRQVFKMQKPAEVKQ